MTLETLQFAVSVTTLLGFVFIVYRTFRDPDIKADKSIGLLKEQLKAERELSFQAVKTMQNGLHTVENQVNENRKEIKELCLCFAKLQVTIEERIPKKV